MNKMVRKQVFITAEQNKRLRAHAAAAGVSEAELVRAGIDLRLERKPEKADWRRLAQSFSSSWAERENLDEEMREQFGDVGTGAIKSWGGRRSAHR